MKVTIAQSGKGLKKVEFEFYAPEAGKVQLAGTFNGWDAERTFLRKEKEGKWKISLPLEAGRYEYRYLVDGVWQNGQRPCGYAPNAFGTWDCVVEVC